MSEPRHGEIWWAELPEEKRRPVLVLTRDAAIPVLRTILVAPITRRIRGIATEVALGSDDGVPEDCVVTVDNVRVAEKAFLTERMTSLSAIRMAEVCRAVKIAIDC